MKALITAILLAFLVGGCASRGPVSAKSKQETASYFEWAKSALENKEYGKATKHAWSFLKASKPTDDNYENAEFILAYSLDNLKLSHAALEYYVDVVRHGAASELISAGLGLRREHDARLSP